MRIKIDRTTTTTASVRRIGVGVATGPRGITANVLGVVRHDADPNVARPTEFDMILWVGSVEPANADLGTDSWVDTA